MKKDGAWYWRTRRSRGRKNFVYLRLALPAEKELGIWLARRARELMDKVSQFQERNLSLSLVDDAEIRRINGEWREKDEHTDVISFPLHLNFDSLGDIIISLDTARRQAADGGWRLEKELDRLLAHGLAHCAGHTHTKPYEALRMAECEQQMLGELGMVGDTYMKKWGTPERFVALAERQRLRMRAQEEADKKVRMAERAAYLKKRRAELAQLALEKAERRKERELRRAEREREKAVRRRPAKKRVSLEEEKR
jgi:probable rRNA maturation factor